MSVEKIGGDQHSDRRHRIDALPQVAVLGGPSYNWQEGLGLGLLGQCCRNG